MRGDYKYATQVIAEELADEQFGSDFYELTQDQQFRLYNMALEIYRDQQYATADRARSSK